MVIFHSYVSLPEGSSVGEHNSNFSMVNISFTSVFGVYEPTNITGGPHILLEIVVLDIPLSQAFRGKPNHLERVAFCSLTRSHDSSNARHSVVDSYRVTLGTKRQGYWYLFAHGEGLTM